MAVGLAVALTGGVVASSVICGLDARFAGRFAISAGAPSSSTRLSPVLALGIFAGIVCGYALLSFEESTVLGAVYRGVLVAALVWIASIDCRWRIIPNQLVYPSTVLALLLCPLVQPGPLAVAYRSAMLGFLVAGGVFLMFFLLSVLIYRRAGAFGLGDVKLAAFVGAALGFPSALVAVLLSTFAGAILAIVWGVVSRDRKAGFPYGPAIVVGAILAMLIAPNGGRF